MVRPGLRSFNLVFPGEAQLCPLDVVLEHLAHEVDQLLRRAVDLPQEPAFHDACQGDDIELRHHVDIRRGAVWVQGADLPTDLLHGAVDNGADIRLKELLEGIPPQGPQGAETEGLVFPQIAEELQQPLLPEQSPLGCSSRERASSSNVQRSRP